MAERRAGRKGRAPDASGLFVGPIEAEIIWPGKPSEVTRVVLPFQSIEQIDEPRAEMNAPVGGLFDFDASTGRQAGGWTNKLIWGDNKLILSSLKNGPLREEIEAQGGLKLIYIDPPYNTGGDVIYPDDFENNVQNYLELTEQIEGGRQLSSNTESSGRFHTNWLNMMYPRLRSLATAIPWMRFIPVIFATGFSEARSTTSTCVPWET